MGENDPTLSKKLAQYKYLVSRSTAVNVYGFAKWDNAFGLYNNAATAIFMKGASEGGPTAAAVLNSKYDSAAAINGIYHFWFHPGNDDWSPAANPQQHINYIKDRNNIWYTGLGSLYIYRYAHEREELMSARFMEAPEARVMLYLILLMISITVIRTCCSGISATRR